MLASRGEGFGNRRSMRSVRYRHYPGSGRSATCILIPEEDLRSRQRARPGPGRRMRGGQWRGGQPAGASAGLGSVGTASGDWSQFRRKLEHKSIENTRANIQLCRKTETREDVVGRGMEGESSVVNDGNGGLRCGKFLRHLQA